MKLKINRVIFYGYAFIIFLMVAWYWYFNKKSTEDLNLLHASITNVISIDRTIGNIQMTDFSSLISAHNQYFRAPSPAGYQVFLESVQTLRDDLGTMNSSLPGNISQRVSGIVAQIVKSLSSLLRLGKISAARIEARLSV